MNRLIVHTINDKKIYLLNLGNTSRYRSQGAFTKEPDTIAWINTFEEKSTYVDMGSFIGYFGIYAAYLKSVKYIQ